MSKSLQPSRVLRASQSVSRTCHQQPIRSFAGSIPLSDETSRLPRVANPSFWSSLVPRFLRKPTTEEEAARRARIRDAGAQERRTGIIFLILGIVVGSNAINIIAIQREMLNFSRQTDAKLDLLREVVQKVKNGEDVDVRRALGTGDPVHEKEWEQVMKELEETDMLEEGRKKRAEKKRIKDEQRAAAKASASDAQSTETAAAAEPQSNARPKFLM